MPIVPATDSAPFDTAQLQTLLVAKRPAVVFRSNDIITVNVAGIDDYAVKQRVSDDGTIIFPLIGKTQVAGLNIEQLQQTITEALKNGGMVRDAQVTIIVEERPKEVVAVLGDVVHPGIYPALGDLTLADYLSEASGFVESVPNSLGGNSAASFIVTLIRPGLSTPVRIPLSTAPQDAAWGRIPLFPGDQIRVDKVGVVYVVGAVRAQGSFSLKNANRTTVTQLIALAGGVGYEADGGGTHIIRKNGDGTTVIPIDLIRILKGKDPDVALQQEDILFVPTNQLKAAIKGGGPSIIVSLATAALYTR
jgi:polysaccharide export outer membrane protein